MIPRLLLAVPLLFAALAVSSVALATDPYGSPPGARQADVHNPYSSSYLPLLPNQPINGLGSSFSGSGVNTWTYPGWSGYGGAYYYSPNYYMPYYDNYYYPYGPGYGYYEPWYRGPYYIPPAVLPAETLYGPQAVRRFLGADGNAAADSGYERSARRAQANNVAGGGADNDLQDNDVAIRGARFGVRIRETNSETKALAGKFVRYGDAHFAKGKYAEALTRYRTAGETASDMAEPFLRQGHAMVALGKYEAAMKAFRRALILDEDWWDHAGKLAKLYGEQKEAKLDHLEALAAAVEQNPQDATLLTLLGLQLFFDGQQQRAIVFFRRANQLGGNDEGLLTAFLPVDGKAGIAKKDAPAARPAIDEQHLAERPDEEPVRRNPPPPPMPKR